MERFCFYFQFQVCCGYGNLLAYMFGAKESINEVVFAKYGIFVCVFFFKLVEFLHEYLYLPKLGCSRIDTKKISFGHCP